jgi:hypothetical protein
VIEQIVNDLILQKVGDEIALRVRINQEDIPTQGCQRSRNIQGERSFSNATLMVEYGQALGAMALPQG